MFRCAIASLDFGSMKQPFVNGSGSDASPAVATAAITYASVGSSSESMTNRTEQVASLPLTNSHRPVSSQNGHTLNGDLHHSRIGKLPPRCASNGRTLGPVRILHFNDCYNIEAKECEPKGGASRFKTALDQHRNDHTLVLFSGDILGPSISKFPILSLSYLKTRAVRSACCGQHSTFKRLVHDRHLFCVDSFTPEIRYVNVFPKLPFRRISRLRNPPPVFPL